MEGILELAEKVFDLPVRLGTPIGMTEFKDHVEDPSFSTGIGLLHRGFRDITGDRYSKSLSSGRIGQSFIDRMKVRFNEILNLMYD